MSISSFPDRTRTLTINIPDRLFTLSREWSRIRCLAKIADPFAVCKRCLAKGKATCRFPLVGYRNYQLLDQQKVKASQFPQVLHQVFWGQQMQKKYYHTIALQWMK